MAPLGRICHMQQSSVLAYSCLTSQEREASVRALSETSIHNSAAVYFQTLQGPQFEAVAASSSAAASVLAVACTGWSISPPSRRRTPITGAYWYVCVWVWASHALQVLPHPNGSTRHFMARCAPLPYQEFFRFRLLASLRQSGAAAAALASQARPLTIKLIPNGRNRMRHPAA